jgi:5-(carboxyamino)imidazole ribonucleotide synthase
MAQSGTVGIIGGGQLGRMLTDAAHELGWQVIVLDPTPNCPAAQAGAHQIVARYDAAGLRKLAAEADYLTTEFEEGLEPSDLEHLADAGFKVNPSPHTIAQILDKFEQKNYLAAQGITMGPYSKIDNAAEAYASLENYGGKMLIKTRRGGYDGYGNRVVSSRKEIDQALKDFEGRSVYAEAVVPFVKELAVIAVRDLKDNIVTYPVVETIQKDNICHEVLAPADIDDASKQKAVGIANQVASQFEGAGAFGIEMFLTENGDVWLNEVAPRVHNSGHYTIEACRTSQFENHIRAITGQPLGPTDLKVPAAVMINILGERDGPVELKGLEQAAAEPHTTVHIYGKSPTKVDRKMGHITATGDTLAQARDRAEQARAAISI